MLDEAQPSQQRDTQSSTSARAKAARDELRRLAYEKLQPVPPDDLCEALQQAVQKAAARSAESMLALQRAVREFTAALRSDGATPEAVLIALKAVINSRTFPVASSADNHDAEELRQRISSWSIQEFFKTENS